MSVRVFAYGGGVQSTAALVLAVQGKLDFPNFIFVNVGDNAENPGTLRYLREVALPYADDNRVGLVDISQVRERITRKGQYRGDSIDLYDYLVDDSFKSVPIPMRLQTADRWVFGNRGCTDRWKRAVLAKAVAPYGEAVIGLGISLDEMARMRNDSGHAHIRNEYPLVDLRLTRDDCVAIIKTSGLPLPPKSSCWFCPFHSDAYWQRLRTTEPELFVQAAQLETTLNRKRAYYGMDQAFLCRPDTFSGVGSPATGEMFEDEICDSGYCMV